MRIIPSKGSILADKIVLMAGRRVAPARHLARSPRSIRRGTGPAALVMIEPDVNLAIGAEVAATLYGRAMPVLLSQPIRIGFVAWIVLRASHRPWPLPGHHLDRRGRPIGVLLLHRHEFGLAPAI